MMGVMSTTTIKSLKNHIGTNMGPVGGVNCPSTLTLSRDQILQSQNIRIHPLSSK